MAQPLSAPYSQFLDANGNPLSGGKVFTYSAGTTTPLASYTDSTGVTPAANPVILDSAGRAAIWLSGYYKIVVKDSLNNTIYTTDNITALGATGDMNKSVYDPNNIIEQLVGVTAVQRITNKTIVGTTSNGAPAAGDIGEVIKSENLIGSAVSLVTGVPKTITSIALTAGDWDIWGIVLFAPDSGTTSTQLIGGINTTTNLLPTPPSLPYGLWAGSIAGATAPAICLHQVPILLSGTTTYYLVAQSTFSASTSTAYGGIYAKRRR